MHLATHTEGDVFPAQTNQSYTDPVVYEDRLTGKGIILDKDGDVALIGNRVNTFLTLPGGGIDDGETIEQGIIRECREEAGCDVELLHNIGYVDDYRPRDKKHCITHCYIAGIVGKKRSSDLTQDEVKNGFHVIWVPMSEALRISEKQIAQLRSGEVIFYNTGFNILRDALFLKVASEKV